MESDPCICYWKYIGVYWETIQRVMTHFSKRIYSIYNFLFFWNNSCSRVYILSNTLWISNPLQTKIAHAFVIHVVEYRYRLVYVHSVVVWNSVDYLFAAFFCKTHLLSEQGLIFFCGLRRAIIATNTVLLKKYTLCILSDLLFMRPSRKIWDSETQSTVTALKTKMRFQV